MDQELSLEGLQKQRQHQMTLLHVQPFGPDRAYPFEKSRVNFHLLQNKKEVSIGEQSQMPSGGRGRQSRSRYQSLVPSVSDREQGGSGGSAREKSPLRVRNEIDLFRQ